jgi:hypothetical protein
MNKQQAIEEYFKALGFKWGVLPKMLHGTEKDVWCWMSKKEGYKTQFKELPNITQHYPDFKKWVLDKMEGEGMRFEIVGYVAQFYKGSALFFDKDTVAYEEIKDNEILEAAVIAATRYWEGKK